MACKAILTKYLPATDHKCLRIVAYTDHKRIEVSAWRSDLNSLDVYGQHLKVAEELAISLGWKHWKGQLIGGSTRDGYAFVYTGKYTYS